MIRWLARLTQPAHLMGLLTALLLTLAAAPFGQWYLAWVALVPWLIVVGPAPTFWVALSRGWLAGVIYFALNEWWLWTATIPGTIGVIICSGFYWGLAGALIYYLRLLSSAREDDAPTPNDSRPLQLVARTIGIAVVWVACEWLRCNTVSEFPWLPIGCTQSPAIVMCQIADVAGVWGVSFIVVFANAFVAIASIRRPDTSQLWLPGGVVALSLLLVASYGAWRVHTTPERAGPTIMLVQSNHPHLPGGASTTTPEKAAEFFLTEIEQQLAHERADLVILPENEFPPLNDEARTALVHARVGAALENTYQRLVAAARKYNSAVLVGGAAVTGWTTEGKEHIGSEIRNSAYLFSPTGETVSRYDKIQLVPFSERLPFSAGPAWLTTIAISLAANRAVQPLHAGSFEDFQPFSLSYSMPPNGAAQANFVTPICLENIDPIMSSRMIRDPTTGRKRAEFFANLSNDGWFHDQEKFQHWQLLVFRCIENRVPMARSSNTGISGFIDSCGRVLQTTAVDQPAAAFGRLMFDDRESFYMAHPDVFPIGCAIVVAVAILARFTVARSAKLAAKN
jgi:apolipoprotein N-acyltransferase